MKRLFAITIIVLALASIGLRASAAGLVLTCDSITEIQQVCTNNIETACTQDSECPGGAQGSCQKITVFKDPCTVNVFVEQFIRLANFALTLVVILAALMFVWGGFQFITAGGRPSKVEEGQRIILGTIVGLMVSFTAFVIVNFSVAAITGSTFAANSINPFGAIARVFSGQNGLERAFNSTGQKSEANNCHSTTSGWDKTCTDQEHCADPNTDAGTIHNLQQKLTDLHCNPNGIDGCFGPNTLEAVRRFQVANDITPTGQLDQRTQSALNATPKACDADAATSALVSGVTGQLPKAQDSDASITDTGCCVIKNAAVKLYCANQVTRRTCDAQGGEFHVGVTSCANDTATRDVCGYCADTRTHQCFQTVSSFWCTEVVRDSTDPNFRMTFVSGKAAAGENNCSSGWSDELLNLPP